jgi:hypothetical protein
METFIYLMITFLILIGLLIIKIDIDNKHEIEEVERVKGSFKKYKAKEDLIIKK